MKNDKILQDAVNKHLSLKDIGDNCKSAFSVVHQCISAVDISGLTEEEKKEILIINLQKFWHGKSKYVAGCQREQIQKIVKYVFGISSDKTKNLNQEIKLYSFHELYLYYCYIEHIAYADTYLSELLWKNGEIKKKKAMEQRRKEQEQKRREQEEAENRKLGEMNQEERWQHEIFENKQDMAYFQKLDDAELSAKDKIVIAGFLKDYWKAGNKWEGDKVSKKQVLKITKIKEILEEKK